MAIGKAIEAQIGNRQGQRVDIKEVVEGELPRKCEEVAKGKESAEVAAEAAGFKSDDTYRRAKAVVEKAAPSVVKAVDAGEVSVSDADHHDDRSPSSAPAGCSCKSSGGVGSSFAKMPSQNRSR